MIPAFIVVGASLLLAAGRIGRVAALIHPAHLVRLTSGVMVMGLFLVEAGLLLWSAPIVLESLGFTDLAEVCLKAIGGLVPGGAAGGVVSLVAAVWLATSAVRGGWRVLSTQAALRIESSLAPAEPVEGFDLVVVPSSRRMAYTIGGKRPQVILTSTVLTEVDSELIDVITAHESVHARYRHYRFLALAAAIETAVGWLPPVTMAVASVRLWLERWADEDAALVTPGGRGAVRQALLTACLGPETPHLAGFGQPEMVSARVAGLDRPLPQRRSAFLRVAYAVTGMVGVTLLVSVASVSRLSILAVLNPGQCFI